MITVVAALIVKDDKVLLARRLGSADGNSGKWEFPGGKVEKDEDEKTAIEREIYEEFNVKVKAIKFLTNNICEYPTRTIDLRLYECSYISGEFKLNAHSEYKYVSKDEILEFDLCEADIPLAKYVKNVKY